MSTTIATGSVHHLTLTVSDFSDVGLNTIKEKDDANRLA